jgi:hypothetical protein
MRGKPMLRGMIAVFGAGMVMILIGLIMDRAGVSLPGGSVTFGLLTALVVVAAGLRFRTH